MTSEWWRVFCHFRGGRTGIDIPFGGHAGRRKGADTLLRASQALEDSSVTHQTDVLVLPSRPDSFGRVVGEAMATGLPTLVSEHVGAKEVLTEGENGWVVPAEDAGALAEQMRWCVEHPGEVAAMQAPAVTAAQDYTWAAYRERVTTALQPVIDDPHPVSA